MPISPQQTPQTVEPGRARGHPLAPQTVQGRQRLLCNALDGHRKNPLVTTSLQKSVHISSVRLVAQTVTADVMRRKKPDLVTLPLKHPAPIVS
jgi:hypothetical protein